jgi:hypothetical protein
MRTMKSRWDVERAAAWLRRHTWGAGGEACAPALEQAVLAAAQAEADAAAADEHDDIDIAGWPALVAPFYD